MEINEEKRLHKLSVAKERREWLKSNGVCISCGQESAIPNRVRCDKCIDKQKEYRKKYKEKHDTTGYNAEYSKERRIHLKSIGICVSCAKRKIYKNSMCVECRAKAVARSAENYNRTGAREDWENKNRCRVCGENVVIGYKVCQRCLDDRRKPRTQAQIESAARFKEKINLCFVK